MIRATIPSPFGPLTLTEGEGRITALGWGGGAGAPETPVLVAAADQLERYFAGNLQTFDLPLDMGEGFKRDFLSALNAIPYGEIRTYGDLARSLGVSAQAIGQACGANRIPILIPCHRVLGAASLGGYSGAGGVETKVALLRLEGAAGLLI